jgi:hypothetical protein
MSSLLEKKGGRDREKRIWEGLGWRQEREMARSGLPYGDEFLFRNKAADLKRKKVLKLWV